MRAESTKIMEDPPGGLPAAGAPFGYVGALHAECGVFAVAGVDPGPVRQRAEHPLLEVVHPLAEPFRVMLGVPGPARDQAVPGEPVGPLPAVPPGTAVYSGRSTG